MEREVRVRFAPSPTGPLHIGGVRTALYNYLFAKKNNGKFILRVEDTDRTRFVSGAEDYITKALEWIGITPDESPEEPGKFGPYRQSERKNSYMDYAQQLVEKGHAYYAFDTSEELEEMRERLTAARVATPQYNAISRTQMKNSLTLPEEEVKKRLDSGEPYVIRLKVPRKEEIRINDMVRDWVMIHSSQVDDKVIMKSDGMPTYHLANVVDDHLMEITHVIRGEEWLPSAPCHVLLYRYLGWEETMPQFAHLPLILKPTGNGKLSKRDGDKLGFPVFPLEWTDPNTGSVSKGFKEEGFLPEALTNFLAFLGWNPGTTQEIFPLEELIEAFSAERINKAGTKFDIDKARWYNQQYLKATPNEELAKELLKTLQMKGIDCNREKAAKVCGLLKERVTFPSQFWTDGQYFFHSPSKYDEKVVKKKWTEEAVKAVTVFAEALSLLQDFSAEKINITWNDVLEKNDIKPGKVMQALRVAVTGAGGGPDLMETMALIGSEEVIERLKTAANVLPIKQVNG